MMAAHLPMSPLSTHFETVTDSQKIIAPVLNSNANNLVCSDKRTLYERIINQYVKLIKI